MVSLKLNGLEVTVEEGMTLLEAARFIGFPIPTLCHMEGLSPYGACRLCVVEIGEGPRSRLVASCTYPVEEGLRVRTASERGRQGPEDGPGAPARLLPPVEGHPGPGLGP